MQGATLAVVQEVRRSMREWIEHSHATSQAPSQSVELLGSISAGLKRVDQAMRDASPSTVASPEWREALAAYSETLGELGARLSELEVTLRVHRVQLSHASSRLGALHSWADLVRHVG